MSQGMSVPIANICAKDETKLSTELDTVLDKFAFPLKTESKKQKLEAYLLNKEDANKFGSKKI